jgi:predicted ABC-type ATPase
LAQIFIIAGPPGIGKSSAGFYFIPEGLAVLDPDQIADRYKKQGFTDYKDIGNLKFNELVKKELFAGNSFAIELNLGYQSHYDFLKSLKNFNKDNSIEVILFYTDDIDLCIKRAEIRHQSGLHLVSTDTINEMYYNTKPLLKENFSMLSSLTAINVTAEDLPEVVLFYHVKDGQLNLPENAPDWLKNDLKVFLEFEANSIKTKKT